MRSERLFSLAALAVALLCTSQATAQQVANPQVGNQLGNQLGNQPVRLTMLVPADAQVWVEGAATTMRGPIREFVSPAIPSGQNYVYAIRVQWQRDGQTVDEKRVVEVKAGDVVRLNYRGAGDSYVATPVIGHGQQAFYYTPEEAPAFYSRPTESFFLGSPTRRWSYYGDTPGWGTADTTGAGG